MSKKKSSQRPVAQKRSGQSRRSSKSPTNSKPSNRSRSHRVRDAKIKSRANVKTAVLGNEAGKPATSTAFDKPHFVEVGENHDGQRIDNFLLNYLKGVPKTHIYRIIRKGEVRVNKGRVKQITRLKLGDSVRIPPIHLAEKSAVSIEGGRYDFLTKSVLFEDDALLVINKPSGMAVHAGSGVKVGVIEALRAIRTDLKYLELVHRLDRATSGCLVLAKKAKALKLLHEDFKTNSLKNKRLDKRYIALCKGKWRFGQRRITKPLNTEARRKGERYVVVDDNGSYASSIATPLSVNDTASLMEVKLLTGRTHQVRVHMLSEGHALAGDDRYGDNEFNHSLKQHGLKRLFLHASSLSFTHPISGEIMDIKAPLPSGLDDVLTSLKLCTN